MTENLMGQDGGVLSASAARVAGAQHDLERLEHEVVDRLDAARSRWTGGGGSAFQVLGHAWSQQQRTIVAALARFEASLRATERDNVATDDAQSAAFARTMQRLG
jgi:uncharacterized protein YukE